MYIKKRRIVADDELDVMETGSAEVAPEATDLLFEAQDVADLVAEVTGEDVEVSVDDESDEVTFAVGEDEYTVTPDDDVEVLESTKVRGRRPVKASARRTPARRVSASTQTKASRGRVIRRRISK